MTESMIERVAVAIARARGMLPTSKVIPQEALWLYFPKDQAFKEARAAIEAMREPTHEMASAALALDSIGFGVLVPASPIAAWEAMIDAALKEHSVAEPSSQG